MNDMANRAAMLAMMALATCTAACAHAAEARGAAGRATVTETEIELPTYPFFDPDPVPATGDMRYPYFFFDGTSATSAMRRWKAVVLENEKIKVTILPEIGGKIWGAVDKATGRDFIYFNNVVKFRNVARRGPWCSGGIEFNFGIYGHTPSTATPVSYCVRDRGDGSVSCFVSDTDLICRTTWQVEVSLSPGEDRFVTRSTWFNGSGFSAPHYHWMNAAYSVRGDPEFFFPGSAYIGHAGDSHAWPADEKGRRLDRYSGNSFGRSKSYHVLDGDNSFYGIWWPEAGIGSCHESPPTQKYGRKIWLWALSREGGIWENLLTDRDGQYAELQSGLFFNQPADTLKTPFKHAAFAPGATDVFEEKWSVVRSRAELERRMDSANYVKRPQTMPADFDWTTAYGLYLKGRQFIRRRMDRDGEKTLLECLAKEPHHVPALEQLASLAVRRGKYADAHGFARRALAVDTYSPEANYADGQAFFAEGNMRAAVERLGIAAFSPEFRAAALALAAKAEVRASVPRDRGGAGRASLPEAERLAGEALLANGLNLDAWLVKLVAARLRGKPDAAAARRILESVPLFHAARYELNLADPASEPMEKYVRCEFPHEVYLEIGTWYEEAGLAADAEAFFRRAAAASPVGCIRLAHVLRHAGSGSAAKAALRAAAAKPIAFALPFRRESLSALRWAARVRPEWKFKYLAAVCLAANAWDEEADSLLADCADEPADETFYLYRASRRKGAERLADLRRAATVGSSWRTGHALYRYYSEAGDWAAALREIEPCAARHPDANLVKIAYGTALARSGAYEKAVAYLEKVTVLPSENGDNALAAWICAWKGIALAALERGDEPAAWIAVAKALSFPENLGRGRPYDCPDRGTPENPGLLHDWPDSLINLIRW